VVRARDGARPHRCNIITITNVGGNGWAAAPGLQQQQPQALMDGAAAAVMPPPPICPICNGPHAVQLPCFIQPRAYERQCQLEEEEEDIPPAPPQLLPFNEEEEANDDDDDDSNNNADEEEEEEGQNDAAHPPPMLMLEEGPQKRARKPLRFLWWDVESEVVRRQNVCKHVPILICAEVLCERWKIQTHIQTFYFL
jgi:hypothetical protein